MIFINFAVIPYEGCALSADEKKKNVIQDNFTWIRNNNPEVKEDPKEGLASALSKITGDPMPTKSTPKHKKLIEDSVEWLRVKNPGPLDMVDDTTVVILLRMLIVAKHCDLQL